MYVFIPFALTPAHTAFGGICPQDACIHVKYSTIELEGVGSAY